MIGYHYTTQSAWEAIREHGLFPGPIRPHELLKFQTACGIEMPTEAIWVWQERLTVQQAWITSILLADIHSEWDLILLKIDYKEADSIPHNYKPQPDDTVNLTCAFGAGKLSTGSLPIDLLMNHIPACQIEPIWEGNLLEPLEANHAKH